MASLSIRSQDSKVQSYPLSPQVRIPYHSGFVRDVGQGEINHYCWILHINVCYFVLHKLGHCACNAVWCHFTAGVTNRSHYKRVVPQCQAKATTQWYDDRLFQSCPGPTNGYIFQPEKYLLVLNYEMTMSCNRLRGNSQIIDLRVRNGSFISIQPLGRFGRNQSPVRRPIWLWHTASWANS
jgi:hypothetical protein